jgi:hypothetical protein
MNEDEILPYMKSYWNNQEIRKSHLKSTIDVKFVLVEGIIDAKIVSVLRNDDTMIPISVSNMKYNEIKKQYTIVDDNTLENRGKAFIINVINGKLSSCFGLVDMDYDYKQESISHLEGKIVDSNNSITSVGKIMGGSQLSAIEKLFSELLRKGNGIGKTKSEFEEDKINLLFLISILGMERFINGKVGKAYYRNNYKEFEKRSVEKTDIYNYNIKDFKNIDIRKRDLEKIVPREKIIFLADHDVVDVFSVYIFGPNGRHNGKKFVKKTFEEMLRTYCRLSTQKICIENENIIWK